MRFSEADGSSGYLIEAYDSNGISIGGRRYQSGVMVMPERIVTPWGPTQPADLTREHLELLWDSAPQIIVLGTGKQQVFPDSELHVAVIERGIGFEVMTTGAACRTYNILVAEGRRVVVGLMPYLL